MVLNFLLQLDLPNEPETDDEAQKKKWKWKVKSVKKENRERYSQRCDIELKLAVCFLDLYVH
jgi:DNA-directed RNA polymerase